MDPTLNPKPLPLRPTPPIRYPIPPGHEPGPALLAQVEREARERIRPLHPSLREIVFRYLLTHDAVPILRCLNQVGRFRSDGHRADSLRALRCRLPLCPKCAGLNHHQKARYQALKIQSTAPDGELALAHSVWTLPPHLNALALHDPRVLAATAKAVFATTARCLGYTNMKKAKRELGLILNLHPWGEGATPFPGWAPHYDVLMPAWRLDTEKRAYARLPNRWPRLYRHTQKIYQQELRRFLSPVAKATLAEDYLHTDFQTDLFIHEPRGRLFLRGGHARAVIHYSTRPHIDLSRAKLERPHPGANPVLVYAPLGTRLIHRRDPKAFFKAVYQRKQYLHGRKSTVHTGYYSANLYPQAARAAGHEPVPHRLKSGWRLAGVYDKDPNTGRFKDNA